MRFGFAPKLDTSGGGIAQYSRLVGEHLEAIAARDGHELVLLVESARELGQAARESSLPALLVRRESRRARMRAAARDLLGDGAALAFARRGTAALRAARALVFGHATGGGVDHGAAVDADVTARLERGRVAWAFFPYHTSLSFQSGVRYVSAIHDLQHRLQPEFPEVAAGDLAAKNEWLIRNIVRHATLLLADSEVGKEDILDLYGRETGVVADRIAVLPYLPPPYLSRVETSTAARVTAAGAPRPYFFYPAQFWPHKNHMRVVEAFARSPRDDVDLVLCGSAADPLRAQTLRELRDRVHALRLDRRVRFLGYVDETEMSGLYQGALALVMPTFFGPTNIPILEAWAMRCPVITSDLRGVRDQAGDAALLVDPRSVDAIADAMWRLAGDGALREELRARGIKRLASYTPADFRARLTTIVDRMR